MSSMVEYDALMILNEKPIRIEADIVTGTIIVIIFSTYHEANTISSELKTIADSYGKVKISV